MSEAKNTATESKAKELVLENGGIVKKILREGSGEQTPPKGADVYVHYVGKLLDGTEFDSSRKRNDKFSFKLGQGSVIKGWDLGVATMKKGELALLTCKPEYAYGERGSPPSIPPNATLQFEVELFSWSTKQKVTEDFGVTKEIITEGQGYNRPNEDATVTLKYSASYDGKVFQKKDTPTTLVLGNDLSFTRGFEAAVQNMKKGEHSVFTVKPSYGYGDKGNSQFNIPPAAKLEYDIELIDFKKGKESWEMSTEEKIEYGSKKRLSGNKFFKAGRLQEAVTRYETAMRLFQYDKDLKAEEKKKSDALKVACHANIGMCKLKQKDHAGAIESCTEALNLDPSHVKCLLRRGHARLLIGENSEAYEDLQQALKLNPGDKAIIKLHKAAKKRIQAVKNREKKMYRNLFARLQKEESKERASKKAKVDVPKSTAMQVDDKQKQAEEQTGPTPMDTCGQADCC